MKSRNGFVSNSSSSSFVIKRKYTTKLQRRLLKNIKEVAEMFDMSCLDWISDWDINFGEDVISGSCFMDNFDMYEFLERIGIDMDQVEYWRN